MQPAIVPLIHRRRCVMKAFSESSASNSKMASKVESLRTGMNRLVGEVSGRSKRGETKVLTEQASRTSGRVEDAE